MNVLVLDDEPWQLSWVEDLVSSCGGRCRFAVTLEEAKQLYIDERPDIVTVDIRIGATTESRAGATLESTDPSWVGLQFLRFVRVEQQDARTKIFVYTGLDREQLQKVSESSFGARFFTKFESREFWNALSRTLKGS